MWSGFIYIAMNKVIAFARTVRCPPVSNWFSVSIKISWMALLVTTQLLRTDISLALNI